MTKIPSRKEGISSEHRFTHKIHILTIIWSHKTPFEQEVGCWWF